MNITYCSEANTLIIILAIDTANYETTSIEINDQLRIVSHPLWHVLQTLHTWTVFVTVKNNCVTDDGTRIHFQTYDHSYIGDS